MQDLNKPSRAKLCKYKCDICGDKFEGKAALHKHLKNEHPDSRRHACTFCTKMFLTKEAREFHEKSEHSKKYICGKCNSSFGFRSELKRHELSHEAEKPFKCHVCQKSYSWKSDLIKHMKTHKDDREVLKCPHCAGFQTHDKKLLEQHLSKHSADKNLSVHVGKPTSSYPVCQPTRRTAMSGKLLRKSTRRRRNKWRSVQRSS